MSTAVLKTREDRHLEVRELNQAELRELIRETARVLGMSFDQAVKNAAAGSLPRNPLGADIALLVGMLKP